MWKVMAETGMSLTPFGHFFVRAFDHIPLPVLRYVFGPVVVHNPAGSGPGAIDDKMYHRWRPRVTVERLEILCGERADLVSPAELALVIYNAALAVPLSPRLAALYSWAVHRAELARDPQFMPDDWLQRHIPTDQDVFDGDLTADYRALAGEVIRKVVTHSTIIRRPSSK